MSNLKDLFLPQENFDRPRGGVWGRIAFGVVVPIAVTWFSVNCISKQSTPFPHRRGIEHLHGGSAIWLATAYLALAGFLHFHFFWGASRRLSRYSQPGKSFSFVIFLAAIVTAIVFV